MPATFTPEQISQILEEFFRVVGTRQYIGARYVPLFGRKDEDTIEWDNTAPYEPLTIVLYQGNSYTSRQFVPVGVEITNDEFWAITGNYNAQVELYRRETAAVREIAEAAQSDINTLLPKADFSSENTVKDYIDTSVGTVQNDIDTLLPKADFSAENTIKDYIDTTFTGLSNIIPSASFDSENTVKDYIDAGVESALTQANAYTDEKLVQSEGDLANQLVTIEKVGTISIPQDTIVQSICTDENGNIFCAASNTSRTVSIIAKLDENWSYTDFVNIEGYPHLNSINYNARLGKIVGISASNVLVFINPVDLTYDVITLENSSDDFGHHNMCFNVIGDFAVSGLSGSNKTIVYRMFDDDYLYPIGSFDLPMRGVTPRQDCCMVSQYVYELFSSGNTATNIMVYRYNGYVAKRFILATDNETEFEGIAYINGHFYVTDYLNNVYTLDDVTENSFSNIRGLPTYDIAIGMNANYAHSTAQAGTFEDKYGGLYHVVACGNGNYVCRKFPAYDNLSYMSEVAPLPVHGVFGGVYTYDAAGKFLPNGNIRGKHILNNGAVLLVSYNRDNTTKQYDLVSMSVYDGGSQVATTGTVTSMTDEDFVTAFDTFRNALSSSYITMSNATFGYFGIGEFPFTTRNPHIIQVP